MKFYLLFSPIDKAAKNKRFTLIDRFRKAKSLSVAIALAMFYQLIFPNISMAVTGGPSSPDFASFEPVGTSNMVNEFSGQFVYNIPVLEIPGVAGGGYSMSLSYHSGDGPETEASWVGAGWTLNPGCINRVKRGVPDDYNGDSVTYYNSAPSNWTVAVEPSIATEFFSVMGGGVSSCIRYNNYKGFGFAQSVGLNALSGLGSLGFQFKGGDRTYSTAVNPAALLSLPVTAAAVFPSFAGSQVGRGLLSRTETRLGQAMRSSVQSFVGSATSAYSNYMHTEMSAPSVVTPYYGSSTTGSIRFTENPFPFQLSYLSVGANLSFTEQTTIGVRGVKTYGYMYSGHVPDNDSSINEAVMDYTIENESTYNPTDKYMPVPTSTPDAFFVSGEGVSGAFRMYNDHIGIFSPNYVKSTTSIDVIGLDLHAGKSLYGAGFERVRQGKKGEHVLKVQSSLIHPETGEKNNGNSDEYKFVPIDTTLGSTESMFFRFNNDLGGRVDYDNSNDPIIPSIGVAGGASIPGSKELLKDDAVLGDRKNGRASYIGYNRLSEMQRTATGGDPIFSYEKDYKVRTQAGVYGNDHLLDKIGEIAVNNENGNRYIYGLPVYCISEKSISQKISGGTGSYFRTGSVTGGKIGEEYHSPYASSYLLTQITTPDYIDVNLNGVDDSDFGGYTKFIYKALYSSSAKAGTSSFYKWRSPYKGVYYNLRRLSDRSDNMGSYQSGFKEIYLLDTIETKTHFAVFITDSRTDSWSAKESDEDAAEGGSAVGTGKAMHKLKQINLYAKSVGGLPKLIKTVHFQYDYTSWPGIPNSSGSYPNNGKLTLKRVWFEYNGVVNSGISPYEFEYSYSNSNYPTVYETINDDINVSGLAQTPSYNPYIDCWGNYQYDGENRRNNLQCWVDQTKPSTFDPAAWQLKKIILPSGGEIHIQYEEHSYAYVQNRMASVMVSLNGDPEDLADGTKLYLNLDDLDINQSDADEKQRLVDTINSYFHRWDKNIYYKFLYTLYGTTPQSIGNCNGEYVDGFAPFSHAGLDGSGVFVEINESVPQTMCKDLITRELGGKLVDGNCSLSPIAPKYPGGGDLLQTFTDLSKSFARGVEAEFTRVVNLSFCKAINPGLSYLRIPFWKKHGGGIRVKRILMFDKGIDAGSEGLYGTEYIYENLATGESYGVATNEPRENGEENPLVEYLDKRVDLTKNERRHQGRDVDQFRGPLSMNALPSASIGYSRIIKKNIHQDRFTGTGYTVVDYNTARDYPFDMFYNALGKHGAVASPIQINNPDPVMDWGFFRYSLSSYMSMAQGYCFIQNQMHGQLKSITDYPGVFDLSFFSKSNPLIPVSQKSYEYFEPGASIPVIDYNTYDISDASPGREMDVTIDRRAVSDGSTITRQTGDATINIGVWPPLPYPPIVLPSITSQSKFILNSVVANKVIHYPAILKKTTTMKDGFYQQSENIAFDPLTTQPVVTRTRDGYDDLWLYANAGIKHVGTYTQYNVPAASQYPDMGQKAWNERYIYDAAPFTLTTDGDGYIAPGVNQSRIFHAGDEVVLHADNGTSFFVGNVVSTTGNDIRIMAAKRYNSIINTGVTYNPFKKIEIIRSGYTGQLSASMGGFLEYGGAPPDAPTWQTRAMFYKRMNNALTQSVKAVAPDTQIVSVVDIPHDLILTDASGFTNPCDYRYAFGHDNKVYYVKITKDLANEITVIACDENQETLLSTSGDPALQIGTTAFDIASLNPGGVFTPPNGFTMVPCYPPSLLALVTYYASMGWIEPNLYWSSLNLNNYSGSNPYSLTLPYRWCELPSSYCHGALKASATTYKGEWNYDSFRYAMPAGTFNDYELGKKGKWRPFETHVLEDKTWEGSDPEATPAQRIYACAGVSRNFEKYPWANVHAINSFIWPLSNKVVSYSPHGLAEEEHNILEKASSVKYGYFGVLPYAVAKNAPKEAIRFEGFENSYSNYYAEDSVQLSNNFSDLPHTGRQSFNLKDDSTITFFRVLDPDGKGHVIKFWVHTPDTTQFTSKVSIKAGATGLTAEYVSRSGNWALYSARYTGSGSGAYIDYKIKSTYADFVIDDIRIQPLVAQMTAYVYDTKTYKLFAVLDENNFATIYQYNGEGKLVRKKLETRTGVKLVEEAQYHTPKRKNLKDIGDY